MAVDSPGGGAAAFLAAWEPRTMISQLVAAKSQPLLTSAIATLMEDNAHIAASIPADGRAQAAALQSAGEDVAILAGALEVLLRRAAEEDF